MGGAQYRGGCSVPWGDIMSTVGGYLEYRGGCSVPWGDIMINVGRYLEYCGVFSTEGGYHEYRGGLSWVPWGMFSTVGGYHDGCGGYHEYRGGCSVPWGKTSFVIWVPHGTEHPPRYSWYPPTCIMISPHGTQISKDGIHPRYWTPPLYSWYPPRASWYPPRYWTSPTVLKITPTVLMISPHGTEHLPRYSRYPPTVLMISPTVLNTPTVLSTPTVLHTHYTGYLYSWRTSFFWSMIENDKNKIFNTLQILKEKFCWFSILSLKEIPHRSDSRENLDRAHVKHVQKLFTFFSSKTWV